MDGLSIIIGIVAGLLIGGAGVYFLLNNVLNKKKNSILEEAEKVGENIKKDKILQAKEKFIALKQEHENSTSEKQKKLQSFEDKLKGREKNINERHEETKKRERELNN